MLPPAPPTPEEVRRQGRFTELEDQLNRDTAAVKTIVSNAGLTDYQRRQVNVDVDEELKKILAPVIDAGEIPTQSQIGEMETAIRTVADISRRVSGEVTRVRNMTGGSNGVNGH